MAEYIEREAFLDYMKGTSRYFNVKFDIENFPAADVAPVVRCENCTSGIMSDDNKYIICCRLGFGMELDDFCSYGEGKNGGSDYATD
jgi:hypothetical protein|nr:MAG TPA: hypothetical protein [Caudoviricetes sp.]